MNTKNLTILIVVTLIVVIAAIKLTNQGVISPVQQKLLPDLMAELNDITIIEVVTTNDKFSLTRTDDRWVLPEKHNYPADISKIRKTLLGAADLTILEAKTTKPELYEKIGVTDVTEKDSAATLLTLKKQDKVVASILIGNTQLVAGGQEIYMRKAGDVQSWLVVGDLSIDKTSTDWLNKSVMSIEDERMREVVITPAHGEKLRIFRETEENQDYQLAEMPENTELSSPYLLKQMATFLNDLNMDDVVVAKDITFDAKESTQAVFKTFDGLEITATLQAKEGKQYAQFIAVAGEPVEKSQSMPESNKETEKTPTITVDKRAQVATEVAELSKRLSQWVYVLPSSKVDNLLKKRDDLVKSVADKGDLSDTVNMDTDFPKGLVDLLKPAAEVKSAMGNPSTALPEVESALGNVVTVSD